MIPVKTASRRTHYPSPAHPPNAGPSFEDSAGRPQRKLCSIGTQEHARSVPPKSRFPQLTMLRPSLDSDYIIGRLSCRLPFFAPKFHNLSDYMSL